MTRRGFFAAIAAAAAAGVAIARERPIVIASPRDYYLSTGFIDACAAQQAAIDAQSEEILRAFSSSIAASFDKVNREYDFYFSQPAETLTLRRPRRRILA